MFKNSSSQEKLERNQDEVSYAETVRNRYLLDYMVITKNNQRHNATQLLQETEIGTTVIREVLSNTMLPTQINYLSNTQSGPRRNPLQRKTQMSGMNFVQGNIIYMWKT